jgi:DNA/RNA endonuclease YhcR with UshA esterase domain
MKRFLTLTCSLLVLCFSLIQGQTVISIATARTMVGSTVTITGVNIAPNFQTTSRSYFVYDGTGGIDVFRSGLTNPLLKLGDSVKVTGVISLYNGLTEITAPDDASLIKLDSNRTVPKPELVTIHDLNTYGENYESHLVAISNLNKVSGATWPGTSMKMTDGKDTVTMYLDADMNLGVFTEPVWPRDVIGVCTQYAASGIGGYELQPRYITDFLTAKTLPNPGPLVSISAARSLTNDTVKINGVVISPNYQSVNRSYYIWDGTAAMDLFSSGLSVVPALKLGDSITVVGVPAPYNGLVEIQPLTDTTFATLIVKKSNCALPQPKVITIHEFNTNGENYESQLVGIMGLTKVSGTWPTSAANATLKMTDTKDTLTLYLDLDESLNSISEPVWPKDIVGIISQYATTGIGGYQLLPRYTTDFLPTGSLPVELTSFTAQVTKTSVSLNWQTASELNNSGFDIERSSDGNLFQKIAFVKGKGTSTNHSQYSFTDNNLAKGNYCYRLKQIDINGTSKYSSEVAVSIIAVPTEFTLFQNYPNPFNPSTVINFAVDKPGMASLTVFNSLGQEVSTLFSGEVQTGQLYSVNFNASNIASGIYFYQLRQGSQIKTQKMLLVK